MKGYGGRTQRDRFEQFDRPALQALPAERFVHADWLQALVNIDITSISSATTTGCRIRSCTLGTVTDRHRHDLLKILQDRGQTSQ